MKEITGGAPYGATTIAGGDGSRQPSANELDGARYIGEQVAKVAGRLSAGGKDNPLEPDKREVEHA